MTAGTKTLIIPGYRGSEAAHWQRHWAEEHPLAEIVEQEDFDHPVLSDWLHVLEAHLAAAPGAVLVAHSLGCALVAHLARRPSAAHVGGALLVAPADVEALAGETPDFAGFSPLPRTPLPFASILVASRDDPFMTFSRAESFAASWGSGLVDLGKAGHINVSSGFGPWPEGVILAEALRSRQSAQERTVDRRDAASPLAALRAETPRGHPAPFSARQAVGHPAYAPQSELLGRSQRLHFARA